jgi:fructose transport system permease protein
VSIEGDSVTTATDGAASAALEEFLNRPPTVGQRVHSVLHSQPALSPAIVLILACVAFSLLSSHFYQLQNLSLVAQQVAVVGTLAAGQTIVILTAGIDLSIGAVMVLSSLVMAKLSYDQHVPGVLALVIGVAIAVVAQAVNGVLVTRIKLPPFIVTLGTLSIFFSLNSVVSKSETIRGADMPGILTWTGNDINFGGFRLTYGSIIMLLLFAFFVYALTRTAWGKHVYATGDDIEAARLAGIRTDRVLLSVYTVAGLLYGIAAWVLIGRLAAASPNIGTEYNLDSITAVVLGGTSLFGGRGAVVGTLIGALIVGVFRNGLQLAGVQVVWQGTAIGLLVLIAVAIDQWIRKVKA